MSQAADYLKGFGVPIPQNEFILVEIRDKNETSGVFDTPKPYVVVRDMPRHVRRHTDARPGDIIELVDIRHLLQFLGKDGQAYALIDRRNVGAVYHPIPGYVAVPVMSAATGPYDDDGDEEDGGTSVPGPSLTVVK